MANSTAGETLMTTYQLSKKLLLLVGIWLLSASSSWAGPLDEMALDRWKKLRETERYQLDIAERFYRDSKWQVAADEYEKYLKLYEKSEGASFAQLKWAYCQVNLRKLNTAIKDGYQTLLDYFPESPEAPIASLQMGRAYKDMGDLKSAKKALAKVVTDHAKHLVSTHARVDLVEIASKESDEPRRLALLQELTFQVDRKLGAASECVSAARQLAQLYFHKGEFEEGTKALLTTCKEADLHNSLVHPTSGRILHIMSELTGSADEKTKQLGSKLADEMIAYLRTLIANTPRDEKAKPTLLTLWNQLADVQAHARRPEKQRETYEQMLTTLGKDDGILGAIAQWYASNNKRDLARQTYLRFQDQLKGQELIAACWRDEKKWDSALEIYNKLSVQDDKNAPRWLSEAAATHRQAGKPDQAIAVYQQLLTRDVKNVGSYHWQIAETYYQFSRWADALKAYRGTENFPTNYQRMAECHKALKQWDEAIALYQQIMVGQPAMASWSLLQIGYTQEKAGKSELAIKTFKQICDKFPKAQEGSTAHKHLNDVYKISVTLGGAKD